MISLLKKPECCGCQACVNACPIDAVMMELDEEGFYYPKIDESRCVQCKKCINSCPIITHPKNNPEAIVYAAYSSDKTERMSSSSGGVFSVLARTVLESGGVVCGAAFQDDLSVQHVLIDDESHLSDIKGTKYVQSSISVMYSEVLKQLQNKTQVLFSGTPCQVAGLRSFLGQEWDNLLCVDLICHGVPSPMVWQDYLHEIGSTDNVVKAVFRCKNEKKEYPTIRFHLESGQIIEEKQDENLFMKGFLQNYYVRPSCFNCHFKGIKRCSDITLGDFWSIKEFYPEFADKYGNSAVIVHSKKGERWLRKAKNNLCLKEAKAKEILVWNECIVDSVKETKQREDFYVRWKTEELIKILSELTTNPQTQKKAGVSVFKSVLKRMLKKEN